MACLSRLRDIDYLVNELSVGRCFGFVVDFLVVNHRGQLGKHSRIESREQGEVAMFAFTYECCTSLFEHGIDAIDHRLDVFGLTCFLSQG